MPTAQFYLTNAGKAAALDAANNSIDIQITHLAVGTAKYDGQVAAPAKTALTTEIARYGVAGGGVNGQVLRLTTTITPNYTADIFEIGLFLSDGTLFAVAAVTGTDPLMQTANGLTSVITLGCSLADIGSNVTVSVDANSPIAVVLMNQHIENSDPHPQYSKKIDTDAALLALKVTTITAGAGLTGGGDLSENRTVTLGTPSTITGTTTNSVTADSHTHEIEFPEGVDISGKADKVTTITAGTGLTGGGDLSANRTFSVSYGTTAGTVAQGNDARINNGQTAYGWGDHAVAGYALASSVAASILALNSILNTKYDKTGGTIDGNVEILNGAFSLDYYGKTYISHANGLGGDVVFSTEKEAYRFDKPIHAPSFVGGNVSIAANGYTSLPNGLIMQWGKHEDNSAVNTHVTFPIAFPTACLNISATAENTDGARAEMVNFYNVNTTGFYWAGASGSESVVQAVVHGHWLAIGY